MLLVSCLFWVLRVYLKVVGDSFDLGNGFYRDSHQRAIAAIQRVASALEIPQGSVCDLDPPRHEGWVNACLILCYLTLEADLFIRIKEV
jgi:hypothetical protein